MALYTDATPTTEAPAVAADAPASRLYAEPAAPAPRTDTDMGRRLFGDTTFASEMPDGAIPDFDSKIGREVAQDIGAEADDVTGFRMLASQPAPTAEQHAEWKAASQVMLKEREFSPADLDLARRFVARDQRLYDALDRGLGSHPQVVERVVLLARSARNAGQFK